MEVPMSDDEGPKAKPVPLRPAPVPPAFKPESKEVPMGKIPQPLPPPLLGPQTVKPDLEDWQRSQKYREGSFLPEGRVEVPLVPAEVMLGADGKRDMAFVDTLAMQTKLGVQNRAVEQSMSLRDSEIVKTRKIVGTSPFEGGGTAVLTRELSSPMNLSTPAMLRGSKVQAVATPSGTVDLVGAEKARKAQEEFWSSPERQSPLPPGVKVSHIVQPVIPKGATPVLVVAPQVPTEETRQKLQELQEKILGAAPAVEPLRVVTVLPPTPPQATVVEVSRHEPVVVEKPASQPVVVTPVIDHSDRILELEAEVAALQNLVIKLATENKTLKAKK